MSWHDQDRSRSLSYHLFGHTSHKQMLKAGPAMQEAINNALKHAHPTQLIVRLEGRRGGQANLSIQDNGPGFSVSPERPEGMGLRTIAYRAGLIGADVSVQSEPDRGTIISCTFSLNW